MSIISDEDPRWNEKDFLLEQLRKAKNIHNIPFHFLWSGFKDDIDIVKAIADLDPNKASYWASPKLLRNIDVARYLWEKSNFDKYLLLDLDVDIQRELLNGRKKSKKLQDTQEEGEEEEDSKNKNNFSSLFKNNIDKLAISQYKGKKSSVISLFKLYFYIVDIRSNDIEEANKFRGKSLPLWKAILKEQAKQFTPNPKVIDTITQSLQVIDAYFKKNKQPLDHPSLKQEKITLYKASRYKTLIVNLIQYMISFFGHMGIRVKPLQIISDVSNIKVIGLMADAGGESPAVSQLLSQVTVVKDKITQNFLSSMNMNLNRFPQKESSGIKYSQHPSFGFISLDTLKTYDSLEELLADVKKEKTIDKNYSKFQVSEGKVILKNKVVTTISYLNPNALQAKISEYQDKINEYNSKLESYEKKLSNEPKVVQLGDHQVNAVKVLYKNISRLIVVDGPYQGHYVDELVSSTGEVIGSASKASPALTETSKTLKSISKSEIESVFTEPIEFSNLQKITEYAPGNLKRILENSPNVYVKNYIRDLEGILGMGIIPKTLWDITGSTILFNLGEYGDKTEPVIEELGSERDMDEEIYRHEISNQYSGIGLTRDIVFYKNKPYYIHNDLFTSDPCLPEGIGTRIFTQQVKSASEAKFEYIETLAAKSRFMVGYYVWPKLGYNTEINIRKLKVDAEQSTRDQIELLENRYSRELNQINKENITNKILNLKKKTKLFKIKYDYLVKWLEKNSSKYIPNKNENVDILEVYACKAGARFIGQELWKDFGETTNMEFDLTPNSLSMRILEAYISLKAKKEGLDPKDYLNIDYSRIKNQNLICFMQKDFDRYKDSEESWTPEQKAELLSDKVDIDKYLNLFKKNISNYENGEFRKIYNNVELKPMLMMLLKKMESKEPQVVQDVLQILNVKLASENKMSEDPMIRELDMKLLDQVWDGINKLYEAGSFK